MQAVFLTDTTGVTTRFEAFNFQIRNGWQYRLQKSKQGVGNDQILTWHRGTSFARSMHWHMYTSDNAFEASELRMIASIPCFKTGPKLRMLGAKYVLNPE